MKKLFSLMLAVLMALSLAACGGGETRGAEITVGESRIYSREDIFSAMELALDQFESGFECCELLTMEYDEEYSAEHAKGWAKQYGDDEAIVLRSSFFVNGTKNPSLNPFDTYKNWQWILTRSYGENWTLQTWGYG